MKCCRDCALLKPTAAFYANSTIRDGLDSYCKLCRLIRQRDRRIAKRARLGLATKPYGHQQRTLDRDKLCRPVEEAAG